MTETILWRRIDQPGHEFATLSDLDARWTLSGVAIFQHERYACRVNYLVRCDSAWQTRSARVTGSIGDREIDLTIEVDEERRWHFNGRECPPVAGCFDIDLGFSPSTNLLPIRRLAMAVGEEAEVNAAWLPFPSLEFQLLPQSYRREAESTYRYASRGGAFVRTLEVNDVGLVTSYPGVWELELNAR